MKQLLRRLLILLTLCMSLGCTHSVHLVNFSDDIPFSGKKNARLIEAQTSQFVVLGFVQQTDYVDNAYRQLQNQCPQGKIGSIATKFYTDHGFFSWTNFIVMDGYCYN